MVLGRTHIKEVAAKRKLELNSYVHNLMRGSSEVAQVQITHTLTFCTLSRVQWFKLADWPICCFYHSVTWSTLSSTQSHGMRKLRTLTPHPIHLVNTYHPPPAFVKFGTFQSLVSLSLKPFCSSTSVDLVWKTINFQVFKVSSWVTSLLIFLSLLCAVLLS